jgi:hypothetical protein
VGRGKEKEMTKQDVLVYGMPSRYIFSREDVLAMPVMSVSNGWESRDAGQADLKVESFYKKNGNLSISIAVADGPGTWTSYGTYSSDRVIVDPTGNRLK